MKGRNGGDLALVDEPDNSITNEPLTTIHSISGVISGQASFQILFGAQVLTNEADALFEYDTLAQTSLEIKELRSRCW